MKKISILTIILLATCTMSFAQVFYEYDATGNRTSRTIVLKKSGKLQPSGQENLLKEEEQASLSHEETLQEGQKITIYPNPTKGLLKIDISNVAPGTGLSIKVFDISGKMVAQQDNPGLPAEVDLSSRPTGVYVLRLFVGDRVSEWKVVRE